ncbi:hypothetical protein [Roseovarius salinarum]|uniref:hypothetical protein n=1 Tax=Roseovarius salinarum TaxID=1981892 RepID=UPI000C33228D|nr:hypothetical protein [Roseovarius salinarum]
MSRALAPFVLAARHARGLLVCGLLAGVALPGAAQAIKPWLAELVAASLFFAALRIGPREALGAARDLPRTLGLVAALQLALPVAVLLVCAAMGWRDTLPALGLALMLAAPPIAGSPSLTVLVGHNPAPALRLLVLGTLLVPLTVLPTLWLMPVLGTPAAVLAAAARLLLVIGIAVAAALVVRGWLMPAPAPRTVAALDGMGVLFLTAVILGLMSALGPALREAPLTLLGWLAAAMTVNLGMQVAVKLLHAPRRGDHDAAVPHAIAAGNRNIALFLVALPPDVTGPLLVFIGCYQVPMYLTPLLLGRFYAPR